jgi:endonuclease/exonuclease/phosphatase family metal-dependent hydrolase
MGIFILTVFFPAGCNLAESKAEEIADSGSIVLMTWNIHNLFDGSDNGFEYDEYLESAGWSAEKYLGRLNAVSDAIGRIDPLPDIIVLQEVESVRILEDVAGHISGGYSHSHFAGNPGAALGVGIISRFPISDTRVHTITIGRDTTPRPVLEARVETAQQAGSAQSELVVFACHWKSKLGGDDVTESVRRASAMAILRRIREIWETEPHIGIIVAGDLNENHNEFYRQGASSICALLPDDPYCAQLTGCVDAEGRPNPGKQKDFIVIGRNKPPAPVHFPDDVIVLYSPWLRDLENGSYYYRYNWETIDHFLISHQFFINENWNYVDTTIVNFQPFTGSGGIPSSYNTRTGSGLSDHLPLLLELKFSRE